MADPQLVEEARRAAKKHGVDPDIFIRMINQESGFNPNARNPISGAAGIAQFMPFWWARGEFDPYDPIEALDRSAAYLSSNLKRFGGDYSKALAAYNVGPGAVEQWGGIPPYDETQRYVANILGGKTPSFKGKGAFKEKGSKAFAAVERLGGRREVDPRFLTVERLAGEQRGLGNFIDELAFRLLGRGLV